MFGTGYLVAPDCIDLEDFSNDYTLNIFTDASMMQTTGCYGAIAVFKDQIIDSLYWYRTSTTANCCEAKGLQLGLRLALKYVNSFTFINIFSDSLLTVNTIRDYLYRWFYNPKNCNLYTGNNKLASNQEVHVENYLLLTQLLSINSCIRIYHQNGHININDERDVDRAFSNFKLYNHIPNYIWLDRRIVKYISKFNDVIDNTSRNKLREVDPEAKYYDPIIFHPTGDYKKPNLMSCYKMRFMEDDDGELKESAST